MHPTSKVTEDLKTVEPETMSRRKAFWFDGALRVPASHQIDIRADVDGGHAATSLMVGRIHCHVLLACCHSTVSVKAQAYSEIQVLILIRYMQVRNACGGLDRLICNIMFDPVTVCRKT